MSKKIIVTSLNPAKIQAVKIAFTKMFPGEKFEFEGLNVPSHVADQPMTEVEALNGAKNRVKNALQEGFIGDYYVGIESGVEFIEEELIVFGWVYVFDGQMSGKGRSSSFFLPPKVAELIKQGKELGEADDLVFQVKNSKQSNGSIGLLTGDLITRVDALSEAVLLALIPFKNKKYYQN